MASTQILKRRIRTARNIKQITKAMEMVAASKMRKAQLQATSSRAYARKLETTLATIATLIEPSLHPLLEFHETGVDCVVLFSTDKSLAGSLNTNLFRNLLEYFKNNGSISKPHFVIVGQKAKMFVLSGGFDLEADFSGVSDPVTFQAVVPIAHYVTDRYLDKTYRSVTLIYMDFVSTLVQKFRGLPLLPFKAAWSSMIESPAKALEYASESTYLFEPDAKTVLDWLLPYYMEMIFYQTMLETRASEHSARMVAMKNASDSANDIINDLTLSYNKQRQAKITNELLDNSTAALAVSF